MAAFFQAFRGSAMPKRLLRYVLSRLEFLDADTLDLEHLDLALGRNTVFEFRDVGIKLQKVEKLLQLPSAFALRKARVLLLRVTVPMDFYTSPITVEVDGVEVRLKVSQTEDPGDTPRKRTRGRDETDVIPSAADLAQSFLEGQASAEKKELEDALAAGSQELDASVAISDTGSDEDLAYGTGQALSLPAFLTDFLQGVVDRTQVRIRGLTLQLDVEVPPVEANTTTPDLVSLQVALEEINMEGVTTPLMEDDTTHRIVPKEGKRHINLENVKAFLISEANVFSTLARSTSIPPSNASQSPAPTERHPTLPHQPTTPDMGASQLFTSSSDLLAQDSEDAFNIPYDLSSSTGEQEQEAEEQEAEEQEAEEEEEEEEAEWAGEIAAREPVSSVSTPRASMSRELAPHSRESHTRPEAANRDQLPCDSSVRETQSGPHQPATNPRELASPSFDPASMSGSVSSSASFPQEDLTVSHLYSHEEAESMYMSAFSQTESTRLRSVMPGAWDVEERQERQERHSPRPSPEAERHPESPPTHREPSPNRFGEEAASPLNDKVKELQDGEPATTHGVFPEPAPEVEEATPPDAKYVPAGHEAQQDDVPTPRGPTRLVKEILSLASLSIYVPSSHKHLPVPPPEVGGSSAQNIPGAFSIHSEPSRSTRRPPEAPEEGAGPGDMSLEIIMAPTEVRIDASIGLLLARVVPKLVEAVGSQREPSKADSKGRASATGPPFPEVKVLAEHISLLFLDQVAGVADTPERALLASRIDFGQETLLKASVRFLSAAFSASAQQAETTIGIEKFTFGYANSDIISFDRRIQMFESVMSTFPSTGQEISIRVSQAADDTRCNVNTLPLHLNLDLQRLDETLGWFGGLSSFLNMGSSMTSSTSRGASSPARAVPRSRGVRFEAPVKPDDQSAAKENKVALRVNGFRVDLIGRECSVALDTSALKLVSREGAIGVHFSRVRLSGPYVGGPRQDPPIIADILGTRLEYLAVPQNADLERLLELITPSKVKFDEGDDEIMVDTLLRQRRKGPVLRLTLDKVGVDVGQVQQLRCLSTLGEEVARLGTVAKYLPEDDRPGLLTLGLVNDFRFSLDVGGRVGVIRSTLRGLELAHITIPSLVAVAVGTVHVDRNEMEELVATSPVPVSGASQRPPAVMIRMIDDMEPVLKVKLMGLVLEYRVPTVMDLLDLAEDSTPQDFEAGLVASVANLGEQARTGLKGKQQEGRQPELAPAPGRSGSHSAKPMVVDLAFRDCLLGLNPLGLESKLVIALSDAHLEVMPADNGNLTAIVHVRKSSVLLVDDVSGIEANEVPVTSSQGGPSEGRPSNPSSPHVVDLCSKGFVDICQISSARATARVTRSEDGQQHMDVELRDDLLVLETCADSTQTLITLVNALKPPTPPSKEIKYKTSVVPVQDLLASLTADAFGSAEGDYDFDNDFAIARELAGESESEDDLFDPGSSPLDLDSDYYGEAAAREQLFDATGSSVISERTTAQDTSDGVLVTNLERNAAADGSSGELEVEENYFGTSSVIEGTAHRWDSARNTYNRSNDEKILRSPLRICVRDVHVIWNLFDGYDWARTRGVIAKAVQDVETKAYERKARTERRAPYEQDFDEQETVIGDFLFNSIYIGIPANRDPRELAQAINQELDDNATETESVATTAFTATPSRAGAGRSRSKKLKLSRSRHHKITFELRGVSVDLATFLPGSGETQSSMDVRIKDLVIFDHVPTSTWKKFAMYDQDAGEREMGSSMVHLEILNVQPVPELAASEIVLRATVLPLRLHVDQDALDFITRFFEFKDDSAPSHASPSDVPFVQRAEVGSVPVKLDFKPKRVDYAGLRSGHTTEFMNFLILEDARMVLRHTIIYGVSGFDRLGKTLNDIWMPDIKRTQLPGILAGLAPVRSLVNVGSGIRDLVEIPIREYRKDGRIVRSISKGAAAFARTTGTEIVKLGAKLAVGTQYALQGAEGLLVKDPHGDGSPAGRVGQAAGWEDEGYPDEGERKQISLYADQPTGMLQGLRGAYSSLSRDLYMARDAVIAVPGEVMESQNAQGVAKAVLKRAPTIIFRPAIGATKAIGQTLLGATNSLDPENRRRVDAKYKKH